MVNDISSHLEFHEKLKIAHWPASNDQVLRQLHRAIESIGKGMLRSIQIRTLQRMGAESPRGRATACCGCPQSLVACCSTTSAPGIAR